MQALRRMWLAIILVMCTVQANGHIGLHFPVIVDTDVALDDVRALALLTQSEDVQLLAVVTSDGACAPVPGARNIQWVLCTLGHAQVPVAPGASLALPPPPWRAMSESLGWSEPASAECGSLLRAGEWIAGETSEDGALRLIMQVLADSETEVTYICLGPLSNLAAALQAETSLVDRISSVYYCGTSPTAPSPSWNTARDIPAAQVVFSSELPILPFHVVDEDLLTFDSVFLDAVRAFGTPAAELVSSLHNHERVDRLVQAEHFRCWDEMLVLGFLFPGLFSKQSGRDGSGGTVFSRCDRNAAYLYYLNLLSGDMSLKQGHRNPVVLIRYPTDPALLRPDIRALAPAIIERHGLEEWHAALLTNELHRHLGIYSLLGAKMGIRAREILGAGVDELRVVSYTGSGPPLSCLTDGLQVATGASLGRGTIEVETGRSEPAAMFLKGSQSLTLRIKDEVAAQIQADIRAAVEQYGPRSPMYWRAVREMALRYWLEMDRNEIFSEGLTRD